MQPQHADKAITQVYVWLVTSDSCVVIVSRDGDKWQLPGGKPGPGEPLITSAVREVREETSLDISAGVEALEFIGYQTVKELDTDKPEYLQVRYLLQLEDASDELTLGVGEEDAEQADEDVIKFVEAVDIDELLRRIPWLHDSPEFRAVRSSTGL